MSDFKITNDENFELDIPHFSLRAYQYDEEEEPKLYLFVKEYPDLPKDYFTSDKTEEIAEAFEDENFESDIGILDYLGDDNSFEYDAPDSIDYSLEEIESVFKEMIKVFEEVI